MPQPPSLGSFDWFSLICSRRGGSTAAAVTLDTAANESRKEMADGVTRSPARLCSRDRMICYYERHEYDFLPFSWLSSYFSCFVLPYPDMFIFFVFLRLCSSHLLLSASTHFVVRALVLVSFVSRFISAFLWFYFFVVLISRVAFVDVLSYPVRHHLICLP